MRFEYPAIHRPAALACIGQIFRLGQQQLLKELVVDVSDLMGSVACIKRANKDLLGSCGPADQERKRLMVSINTDIANMGLTRRQGCRLRSRSIGWDGIDARRAAL